MDPKSSRIFAEVTDMKKQFGLLTVGLALAWAGTAQAANANAPTTACKSISKVLAKDPQFSTLYNSLRAAGLLNSLGQQGSYTLFAPDNAAFRKMPAQQLADLFADPAALRNLLLYHVVPERATLRQIRGSASGVTMQGSPVVVSDQTAARPSINNASVVKADIGVCGGMVHTVDNVLLPATLTSQAAIKTPRTGAVRSGVTRTATAQAAQPTRPAAVPVASVASISALPIRSQLRQGNGGQRRTATPEPASPVQQPAPRQQSAPTRVTPVRPTTPITPRPTTPNKGRTTRPSNRKPIVEAKNVLSGAQAASVSSSGSFSFDVALIPALPHRVLARQQQQTTSVSHGSSYSNSLGHTTNQAVGSYTQNGSRLQSKVALKSQKNQVIRVSGENIAQLISKDPRFSVLRELLSKTGLLSTLSMEKGEYTLFAPTNKAFAKLDKKTLAMLATDPVKLKAALMYHMISGRPVLAGRRSVPVVTVESSSLMIARDSGRLRLGKVNSDGAAITAKNGDVYAIDAVLIPPTVYRN